MKKILFLLLSGFLFNETLAQTNGCFYSIIPNTFTISPHGQAHSIATGDFNNDGHVDLAIAANNSINILLGNSTGNFTYGNTIPLGMLPMPISNLTALHFDNNSNLDLAFSNNSALYYLSGDGLGGFTTNNVSGIGCSLPGSIYADYLNNDQDIDIMVGSNCNPSFYSYYGDGNGSVISSTFANAPSSSPFVNSILSHDVNLDGLKEIIAAHRNLGSIGVFAGSATNTYTNITTYTIQGGPIVVRKGDLNNDGFIDLVTLNTFTAGYSVLLGTASATFMPAITTSLTSTAKHLEIADFDLDGSIDMAISFDEASDHIKIYKGLGNGTFAAPTVSLSVGNDPARFAAIDVNNDAKTDIVCTNRASNNVQIWLNGNILIGTVPSYSVCNGSSVSLNASGAQTYTWSFGANGPSVQYPVSSTTLITVTGSNTLSTCTSSASIQITGLNTPTLNALSSHSLICSGETATLSASGSDNYLWSNAATTSVIIVQLSTTATFSVVGTNTNNCSSTSTVNIMVSPCTSLSEQNDPEFTIYPNPAKDIIHLSVKHAYSFELINSLGSVVFKGDMAIGQRSIKLDRVDEGIYFIKLFNAENTFTRRIIIYK